MAELRELRRSIGISQAQFANLLDVSTETFRTWDSGRRSPPTSILQRARGAVLDHGRETELLSLDLLASEFGCHQRTLRAAARSGKLRVHFSSRSAFGRPIRYGTRADVRTFKATHYRRSGGQQCSPPLPAVPVDYNTRLRELRHLMRLSQGELARRIGAAGKAVVYQWEARKRIPSAVFWKTIEDLKTTLPIPRRQTIQTQTRKRGTRRCR